MGFRISFFPCICKRSAYKKNVVREDVGAVTLRPYQLFHFETFKPANKMILILHPHVTMLLLISFFSAWTTNISSSCLLILLLRLYLPLWYLCHFFNLLCSYSYMKIHKKIVKICTMTATKIIVNNDVIFCVPDDAQSLLWPKQLFCSPISMTNGDNRNSIKIWTHITETPSSWIRKKSKCMYLKKPRYFFSFNEKKKNTRRNQSVCIWKTIDTFVSVEG